MGNLVVIGSQWGDEGKGKIVDILAREADVIVRFQGGSNAGHTVVTKKGTFIFSLDSLRHSVPGKTMCLGKRGGHRPGSPDRRTGPIGFTGH